MSQRRFNDYCQSLGYDDANVEKLEDCAFVSIIGTKDVLKEYLNEGDTQHYFIENHPNVLNLEFDDVDEDTYYNGYMAYAINEEQAKQLYEFIKANDGKSFYVHCRAGQSRSRAVVDFLGDYFGYSVDGEHRPHPNYCVKRMLTREYIKDDTIE